MKGEQRKSVCVTVGRLEGENPRWCDRYLFIILQLVVQDDAVGLVGLGPGQGDAVHGTAHLVHDGHGGRSCKKHKRLKTGVSADAAARQPCSQAARQPGSASSPPPQLPCVT